MKTSILKLFTAALLVLLSGSAFAQSKIYLCQDYNVNGDPIGVSNTWNIKASGGNIYILYTNDGVNFKPGNLSIYIDKRTGSSYGAYDTRIVTPYKNMNWLLVDYKFTAAGDYKVSVVDKLGNFLATEYFTVQVTGATNDNSGSIYKKSTVDITSGVDESGNAFSILTDMKRISGSVTGTILLKNPEGLRTTEIVVDIYIGEGTEGFVHTKRFTVDPGWVWTKFDYTFYVDGKFRFVIHTKENKYINTGYINIGS